MDMPSRWPSIVSYGPSLRWRFQLVRESEYRREARSLLDDKTLADAAHMRAAKRKVNIFTSGREIAGRIGRSALQCTTTMGSPAPGDGTGVKDAHDCQDKRRFFSDARATPPLIFGLMTSSSTVTL